MVFERLAGRLKTLETVYGESHTPIDDIYAPLIYQAKDIILEKHELKWQEWERFSGIKKESMQFGGLMGTINYQGDLTPFLPYLALGEWLHIGNKTSFGFGKYVIQ